MKLSDTQTIILNAAANRADGLAVAPPKLPAAARNAVARSLEKNGLLEDLSPVPVSQAWRQGEDGTPIGLRITRAGLVAIGVEPSEWPAPALHSPTEARTASSPAPAPSAPAQAGIDSQDSLGESGPASPRRPSIRDAAVAVLTAWDGLEGSGTSAMDAPIASLRSVLAGRATARSDKPRTPREGTKRQAVLALLRRTDGATVAQIAETTGWASHTVRSFLAGLKRKGFTIETLERVRMAGPGKAGGKGSYTTYRIQDAA